MHALIRNDAIVLTGPLPHPTWPDPETGRWWDMRNPEQVAEAGFVKVVEVPRPEDTETVVYENWDVQMVEGVPTMVWPPRTLSQEEIAAEFEQNARLDDHEARIARIEAHLWPAPPDPTEPTDAPQWGDLDDPNVWPNGGLLLDTDGKVYRNISGSILTSPPSDFPGGGDAWLGNLFVVALDSDPEPTTPDGYVGPWDPDTSYAVDNVVDKDGRYYRCLIAHGDERQGTWAPGPANPTVWTDLGPI